MLSNMKYVRYLIPYDDMMSCDLSWNYGRQFSSLLSALKKSLDPKPRLIGHRVQVTVKRLLIQNIVSTSDLWRLRMSVHGIMID